MRIRRLYKEDIWNILANLNKDLECIIPRYIYKDTKSILGKPKKSIIKTRWNTYPCGTTIDVWISDNKYEKEFIDVCNKYANWIDYIYIQKENK